MRYIYSVEPIELYWLTTCNEIKALLSSNTIIYCYRHNIWVLLSPRMFCIHQTPITTKIDTFYEIIWIKYQLKWQTNPISNMTDCFVFPDKLSKKSTRCLCVKITNQTSGPNGQKHVSNQYSFYYFCLDPNIQPSFEYSTWLKLSVCFYIHPYENDRIADYLMTKYWLDLIFIFSLRWLVTTWVSSPSPTSPSSTVALVLVPPTPPDSSPSSRRKWRAHLPIWFLYRLQ